MEPFLIDASRASMYGVLEVLENWAREWGPVAALLDRLHVMLVLVHVVTKTRRAPGHGQQQYLLLASSCAV